MKERLKQLILNIIEHSEDLEYLNAIYTFACSYPDKSRINPPKSV